MKSKERMSEENGPNPTGSRTFDFSTGKKGLAKKKAPKGFAPVVQQTINLSTPKAEKVELELLALPKNIAAPKSEKKENRKPRSQGNSLADLLDPETLAKLRGNG